MMRIALTHPAALQAHGALRHRRLDAPDWWHRDHPVFTPLTGFFSGLCFVLIVPGVYAEVLNALFPRHTAEDLFPFVLLALALPAGLVARDRTRRFGLYFVVGMVSTVVAVLGVASLVVWALMATS